MPDTLTKVKDLFKISRVRALSLRVAQISKLWKGADILNDLVTAKDLELHTMPGLRKETSKLLIEAPILLGGCG